MTGYGRSPQLAQFMSFIWCLNILLRAAANVPAVLLASHQLEAGAFSLNTTSPESSFWSSASGNYTLGFRAVDDAGTSSEYLLSIWHSGDPNQTAIWWPLGEDAYFDPSVKAGASFHYTGTGSLELHGPNGALLWSTNTSSAYAVLEDTGNLVLYQNSGIISWQSIADSRDSLMLAQLDRNMVANRTRLLQSRRNESSYARGPYQLHTDKSLNVYLHGTDVWGNTFLYLYASMSITDGFWIGTKNGKNYTAQTESDLQLKRLTLDYDGNLKVFEWQANSTAWREMWRITDSKCMLGSPCGPFGICGEDKNGNPSCTCPTGYHARVAGNPQQGCESGIAFNASCGLLAEAATNYTTTMVELAHSDYAYNDLASGHSAGGVSLDDCKSMCLDRCAECMAASYFRSVGSCFLKGSPAGYLMNGMASQSSTLLLKVVLLEGKESHQKSHTWVIAVVIVVAVLALVAFGFCVWLYKKTKAPADDDHHVEAPEGVELVMKFYTHDELRKATRGFTEELGKGGFGAVYKGHMRLHVGNSSSLEEGKRSVNTNDDSKMQAVAVKVLQSSNTDHPSYIQFTAEINTLGRIHHVNLVRLRGYSYGLHGKMLVYDFIENGSLDKYLSPSRGGQAKLSWDKRYTIAKGIARGIAYLHHDCGVPILHCDIKPQNVLLDSNFTAKVADFGLAMHLSDAREDVISHISLSNARGTPAYIDPEFLKTGHATVKVDVYSFGKLLIELVRGFRCSSSQDEPHLLQTEEWASKCISQGAVMEFSEHPGVQEDINDAVPGQESTSQSEAADKLRLIQVGMRCIHTDPSQRPSMEQVVRCIEGTCPVDTPPIDLAAPP